MKTIEVPQGSIAWRLARAGIATASCFDMIIQPVKMGPSSQQNKYMARLLAEWWLGYPLDDFVSPHMLRGHELEPEARAWHEFDAGCSVTQVGFCVTDDGMVGCSPDGLIGEDGGLELKVPGAEQHMAYVLDDGRSLVADYRCQVQGCLMVTGRKWWDVASFSPVLPSIRVRVEPDLEFIAAMRKAVEQFCERLSAAKRRFAPEKAARDAAKAAELETVDTGF